MITENLSTLKIHKLTQAQYDREFAAGNLDENAIYLTPAEAVNLSGYATEEYVDNAISAIEIPDEYITETELTAKGYLTSYTEIDPTVPDWAKAATKPTYTASEVGADASGTASSLVSAHNTATDAHTDIREEINTLAESIVSEVMVTTKGEFIQLSKNSLANKYADGVRLIAVNDGYTNLVPLSTNKDGSIYCGRGYIQGYRLSSNDTLSAQLWACVSGFIPFSYGQTIRIVGSTGPATNASMYIALYDSSYTLIEVLYINSVAAGNTGSYIARKDGFYEATVKTGEFTSGTTYNNLVAASYIRVSLNPCEGQNMIVTLDEEIPEEWSYYTDGVSAYTNLVSTSIGTDGNIYNTTGYKQDYRLSSSGSESSTTGACVSGFIPFSYGVKIRMVGATGEVTNSGMYIGFYDSNFNVVKVEYLNAVATGTTGSYVQRSDGLYEAIFDTSTLSSGTLYDVMNASSYIRVSLNPCDGQNMVVTYNEEILEV